MSNPRGDVSLDPNAALMSGQTSSTDSAAGTAGTAATSSSGGPSGSSPSPSDGGLGGGSGPYIENYWDDNCMLATLSGIYQQYRFFNGPISRDLKDGEAGRVRVQGKLEKFLPKIVLNTRWDHANVFTALGGIHFLPVDKHVYLQLHRLVSEVEDRYRESVLATTVLYADHLVWSGLEQQDVRVLYKMLISHLGTRTSEYPFFVDEIHANIRKPDCKVITQGIPVFLAASAAAEDDPSSIAGGGGEEQPHTLVVYMHQQLIFAFVLRAGHKGAQKGFFEYLKGQLEGSVLSDALSEHFDRKTMFDTQYKYIYFNQMNLALKTSLQGKGDDIDGQTMETLKRMHDEFEKSKGSRESNDSKGSKDSACEILVKSYNDRWIVGRRSEQREFFVIFDGTKGANLTEINEEVKKLSSQYFQSIFITE